VAELAQVVQGELPWWASAVAAVLLSLAAAIARRVARRSARPQGERLGQLERLVLSEQTRRRQAEAELADRYGVELPYWPPDGPRPRHRDDGPDWTEAAPRNDEDQADALDDARTRVAPSIPPLPEYPQHRR
jgi:hypothetical protein